MNENFQKWLVGFTDGCGYFSIKKLEKSWGFSYKLSQSTYNIKLMYYIKKMLKVGSLTFEKDLSEGSRHIVNFRIIDRKILKQIIFPIFDKYKLLTSKKLDYNVFKEACFILENPDLTNSEKDLLIIKLKEDLKKTKKDLIKNNKKNINNHNIIDMSNEWLIGFWEAEGSFLINSSIQSLPMNNKEIVSSGERPTEFYLSIDILRRNFREVKKKRLLSCNSNKSKIR